MMDALEAAYVRKLEEENEYLRERILQLEELTDDKGIVDRLPHELGLTTHEAGIVSFLMKHPEASKERLLTALYGHLPSGDEPEMKIIDVFVCKVRKKLKPFGIEITTLWGRGYAMSPAAKAAVLALSTSAAAA